MKLKDETLKDIDKAFKSLEDWDEVIDKIESRLNDSGLSYSYKQGLQTALNIIKETRNDYE